MSIFRAFRESEIKLKMNRSESEYSFPFNERKRNARNIDNTLFPETALFYWELYFFLEKDIEMRIVILIRLLN